MQRLRTRYSASESASPVPDSLSGAFSGAGSAAGAADATWPRPVGRLYGARGGAIGTVAVR